MNERKKERDEMRFAARQKQTANPLDPLITRKGEEDKKGLFILFLTLALGLGRMTDNSVLVLSSDTSQAPSPEEEE